MPEKRTLEASTHQSSAEKVKLLKTLEHLNAELAKCRCAMSSPFAAKKMQVLVSHNGYGFDARFLMAAFEFASIAMPAGWRFGDSLHI